MVGEVVLVILELEEGSSNSLGGRSKHLGSVMAEEKGIRLVQGLGFPGSSSHRNGTEAEVYSGGVSMPE